MTRTWMVVMMAGVLGGSGGAGYGASLMPERHLPYWVNALGIAVATAPTDASGPGLPAAAGLVAVDTAPGGPAHLAVLPGDILLSMNGEPLTSPRQFQSLAEALPPETRLTLRLRRADEEHTVPLVAPVRPAPPPAALASADPGAPTGPTAWMFGTNAITLTDRAREQIQAALNELRDAYRHSLPPEAMDEMTMERFMADVRERLIQAYVEPDAVREAFQPRVSNVVAAASLADDIELHALSFEDARKTATLSIQEGNARFLLQDKDGNLVFEGPIDTAEQRDRLPGEAQKYLQHLENRIGEPTVVEQR